MIPQNKHEKATTPKQNEYSCNVSPITTKRRPKPNVNSANFICIQQDVSKNCLRAIHKARDKRVNRPITAIRRVEPDMRFSLRKER